MAEKSRGVDILDLAYFALESSENTSEYLINTSTGYQFLAFPRLFSRHRPGGRWREQMPEL
jgi:hypothetical protein